MSVGFGFSFGDFVSGIQLIVDICNALRDAEGASAEIKALHKELELLKIALEAVKNCKLEEKNPLWATASGAATDCTTLIGDFLKKIKKYTDIETGGSKFSPRDNIRKIKWALLHKDDVENLRTKVESQVTNLNLLLSAVLLMNSSAHYKSTDDQQQELNRVLKDINGHLERNDGNQTQLLEKIQALVLTAPQIAHSEETPPNFKVRPLMLIGSPTIAPDHAVDRVDLLGQIKDALSRSADPVQKIVVLQGMGGIGKSELARSYALAHQTNYSAVFWLNAKEERTLRLSLAKLAEQIPLPSFLDEAHQVRNDEVGIKHASDAVLAWLSHKLNTEWLLIFDNVDSQDNESMNDEPTPYSTSFDARIYFPKVTHGNILLTSRLTFLGRVFGAKVIRVEELSEHEGVNLLCKTSNRQPDEPGIKELVQRLGAHPLALSQAGRHICSRLLTPESYIKKYDDHFKKLLTKNPYKSEYDNGSIWTTLGLSYEQVVERSPVAAALLLLCGYLDNSWISYELFRGLSDAKRDSLFADGDLPIDLDYPWIPHLSTDWLSRLCADEELFEDAVAVLHEFSFVRHIDRSEGISMHPVIHDWALHYIDISVEQDGLVAICRRGNLAETCKRDNLAAVCNILGSNIPQLEPYFKGIPHAKIQPHVDRWFSLLPKPLDISRASVGAILGVAAYYDVQGPKERACELRRIAYENVINKSPKNHRCIAEAGIAIAMDYFAAEEWEEAAKSFELHEDDYSKINWPQSGLGNEEHAKLSKLLCTSQLVLCYHLMDQQDELQKAQIKFTGLKDDLKGTEVEAVGSWLYFMIQSALEPSIDQIIKYSTEMLGKIKTAKKWPLSFGTKEHAEEKLCAFLGRTYMDGGNIEEGQPLLRRAYSLNRQLEGSYSPENLSLAYDLLCGSPQFPQKNRINHKSWRNLVFQSLQSLKSPVEQPHYTHNREKLRKWRSEHPEWARLRWAEAISTALYAATYRPPGQISR